LRRVLGTGIALRDGASELLVNQSLATPVGAQLPLEWGSQTGASEASAGGRYGGLWDSQISIAQRWRDS